MIHSLENIDPELFFDSKRKMFIYSCLAEYGNTNRQKIIEVEYTLTELINLKNRKSTYLKIIKQVRKYISEDDDFIHNLDSELIGLL